MNSEPGAGAPQREMPRFWHLHGADYARRANGPSADVAFDEEGYRRSPEYAQLGNVLVGDPVTNVYLLADLHPQYAPVCRWYGVEQGDARAAVLVYEGLEPPILLAAGPHHLVAETLVATELPSRLYMNVAEPVYEVLRHYYDFGDDVRPMIRMALDVPSVQKTGPDRIMAPARWWTQSYAGAVAGHGLRLVRLTPPDARRIRQLYGHGGEFTPDGFADYQLVDGVFFGVEDGQANLIATGGTHVLDREHSVAAIGNMYTQPQWRGRGLAKAVLGAIVAELCAQEIVHIVLNVDLRNNVARSLYERMGFRVHCEYVEGCGERHSTA